MGSRRVSIVLTALITLDGTLSPALLPGTPPAPLKELRERRERLVGRLRPSLGGEERGAFLWRSGKEPGQDERFRPDPNFFYLTGHEEPGASMLLSFTRTAYEETLLLPARDPSREKWTGAKLGPGAADPTTGEPDEERHAAMRRTGFGAVAPAERLDAILESREGSTRPRPRLSSSWISSARAIPNSGWPTPPRSWRCCGSSSPRRRSA